MTVADIVGEPLRLHRIGSRAERARRVDDGAGPGRAAARGRPALPARALRRPAPAGQPGPGPVRRSVPARRRRADLGAGRLGAGGGAQPDRPAAVRARLRLPVHHPRPGRGGVPGPAGRGDVPRVSWSRWPTGTACSGAAAPVHAGAAVGGTGPGPGPAAVPAADRALRRGAQPGVPAVRVPVPPAVSGCRSSGARTRCPALRPVGPAGELVACHLVSDDGAGPRLAEAG